VFGIVDDRGVMEGLESRCIRDKIPAEAILIIGAGMFGSRAARILLQDLGPEVFIIDVDGSRLARLDGFAVRKFLDDGARFLIKNHRFLNPRNTIVPAIPRHLAFEWLKGFLDREYRVNQVPVPEPIETLLPHTWPGSEGSVLVSYADFVCPSDCSEPDFCTVTGERRERPLYERLRRLNLRDFNVHVIQSRQLAPGLGGYRFADLTGIARRIRRSEVTRWIVGTACKCHGILTALDIQCRDHQAVPGRSGGPFNV
jgi:hypothetical protein